jgi:hypothetical protein
MPAFLYLSFIAFLLGLFLFIRQQLDMVFGLLKQFCCGYLSFTNSLLKEFDEPVDIAVLAEWDMLNE